MINGRKQGETMMYEYMTIFFNFVIIL